MLKMPIKQHPPEDGADSSNGENVTKLQKDLNYLIISIQSCTIP